MSTGRCRCRDPIRAILDEHDLEIIMDPGGALGVPMTGVPICSHAIDDGIGYVIDQIDSFMNERNSTNA